MKKSYETPSMKTFSMIANLPFMQNQSTVDYGEMDVRDNGEGIDVF